MDEILLSLNDVSKKHQLRILHNTKANGLTIAEWNLLNQIINGNNTQDKISMQTGLDISTLSRQLKRLVEKSMIIKKAIGHDKRQLVYTATNKGQQSFKNIELLNKDLDGKIFNQWSDEEKQVIQKLILRLNNSLSQI